MSPWGPNFQFLVVLESTVSDELSGSGSPRSSKIRGQELRSSRAVEFGVMACQERLTHRLFPEGSIVSLGKTPAAIVSGGELAELGIVRSLRSRGGLENLSGECVLLCGSQSGCAGFRVSKSRYRPN